MKIRDPNFNVEGLKVIYKQALVSLLEFICTKTNGGGYSGKPKWSLEDRLNSFKPHLGEENNA